MIISVFTNESNGDPEFYTSAGQVFEFDIHTWLKKYRDEVTAALEAEGAGRELIEARTTLVSTDRYILDLRVRWADGRSASVRETLLIARFTPRTGYQAISSIGGVAASQA